MVSDGAKASKSLKSPRKIRRVSGCLIPQRVKLNGNVRVNATRIVRQSVVGGGQ